MLQIAVFKKTMLPLYLLVFTLICKIRMEIFEMTWTDFTSYLIVRNGREPAGYSSPWVCVQILAWH